MSGNFTHDKEVSLNEYFRELIVRCFQFGLFCPVMRLHGAGKKPENYVPRHPGVKEISGGDNEIWSFGETNYPILKDLVELRRRLRPYILEQTKRRVYLPEGIWVRTTDKKVYTGGCFVECGAKISEYIAFVKEGAKVLEVF